MRAKEMLFIVTEEGNDEAKYLCLPMSVTLPSRFRQTFDLLYMTRYA